MTLLDLTIRLLAMQREHGNIRVMIDSSEITNVECVNAIDGEYGKYVDLCSQDE